MVTPFLGSVRKGRWSALYVFPEFSEEGALLVEAPPSKNNQNQPESRQTAPESSAKASVSIRAVLNDVQLKTTKTCNHFVVCLIPTVLFKLFPNLTKIYVLTRDSRYVLGHFPLDLVSLLSMLKSSSIAPSFRDIVINELYDPSEHESGEWLSKE